MSKTALRNAGKQFRMWMPNMPIFLVTARNRTPRYPLHAVFRCPPKMTKWEIREYLTKIYDLPVRKVNTMNYMGARKRVIGSRGIAYYKYADFKKAVVYMDESKMSNVGMVARIPELEEMEAQQQAEEEDSSTATTKQIGA